MAVEKVATLVIGGGQAGLAMSEHLSKYHIEHLVVERHRIAERWRSERWDSLVANGPAWHDKFPGFDLSGIDPDGFAPRDMIVDYFVNHAKITKAPIRCGLDVLSLHKKEDGSGFRAKTSTGVIEAANVVVATGPFQRPVMPKVLAKARGVHQIHSNTYRNPDQMPGGAVLVIGAGSSGAQIADDLLRAGTSVFLSIGPHDRPPRRYRGRDFVWWLGVLGMWDAVARDPAKEHVTIAVSGAYGGHTIDFRRFAAHGMTLLGRANDLQEGVMHFAADVGTNIKGGDANYLSTLDLADAYVRKEGLDLPEESDARRIEADPLCVTDPILQLNLKDAGVTSIIWSTGYVQDFDWLKVDAFDGKGRLVHRRGVSVVPGLYFLGLPWLSRRASSFIWGAWHDAAHLADHIAARA